MTPGHIKISAVVTTENNEDTIEKCLESIKGIDDIVVVDSFSRDRTVEIAKKYTKRIYFRKWDGFTSQKKYALSLAKHEWVLFLDSDEVLGRGLIAEIYRVLVRQENYTGYALKRITIFLGRELKYAHGYENLLRLFRKGKTWLQKKKIDINFETENPDRIDGGTLYHFTSTTLKQRLIKIKKRSSLFAEEFYHTDKAARWFINMIYWPFRSFFGNYFIKKGFKDGIPGLVWCVLKALQHFLTYCKIGIGSLRIRRRD